MDFSLDSDQTALIDAVTTILTRHAGNARAREVGVDGHDDALLAALSQSGFLGVWHETSIGPLGAALIAEQSSLHNARANVSIRTLVAPALLGGDAPDKIAVTRRASNGPVRFGQHATTLLVLDGDEAFVAEITSAQPVKTAFGYPYAYVETASERSLGPGSGLQLSNWWRVAIAVEIAGALEGSVNFTVGYLAQRTQFNKPLGALQALQHRLAEAHIVSEGSKWLARRAAYEGASAQHATAAAAYSAWAAGLVGADVHQMAGAIGFTTEFDLQLWSARLQALRLELGGVTDHQLATASAHWG